MIAVCILDLTPKKQSARLFDEPNLHLLTLNA